MARSLKNLRFSLAAFRDLGNAAVTASNAPVVWDRDAGGYRFDKQGVGDAYGIAGLWFNASRLHIPADNGIARYSALAC